MPFIVAAVLVAIGERLQAKVGLVALGLSVSLFLGFISYIPAILKGDIPTVFYSWVPAVGLNLSFSLDGLSMLFALLITGIGALVVLYAHFYLAGKESQASFYIFLLLFMGAMLGTVTSANLALIYLFWEVTSVSSFLLIGLNYHKEPSILGAQKALFVTVAGSLCMLLGFLLLWNLAGSFEIREILAQRELIKADPLYPAIVILVLLGAFCKSAQIPFHIWLPSAMVAYTPISCYLHSATMVKAGIYLIARLSGVLGDNMLWFGIIASVGIISMVYGAYMALKQTDLKAILAFSTISQLGLIIALLGFGTEAAVAAALFHLLNHAVFKGSLFLMAGMVDHSAGTRDITKLGGLAKAMPVTAVFCACSALAMAGLPPFNGFLSKEMFFAGSLEAVTANLAFLGEAAWAFPVLAVVGSIFTLVYSLAIFFKVFWGSPPVQGTPTKPREASWGMLLPTGIMAGFTLLIAIIPGFFADKLLTPAIGAVTGTEPYLHIYFWHGFNGPLLMTALVVGIGLLLFWRIDGLIRFLATLPVNPSSERFYDWLIPCGGLSAMARHINNTYATGLLRDYLAYILLFFLLIVGGTIGLTWSGSLISFADLSVISIFEFMVALTLVVAAVTVAVSRLRLLSVMALGMAGYCVAFLFVFFRAPDLALTQLLVETFSLLLFLLVFRYLPRPLRKYSISSYKKVLKIAIAGSVGVLAFLLTMIGYSNRYFEPVSWYFIENSYELAGGKNIVNVILVDFRGLDTMGEIAVIGLATLGVLALINLGFKPYVKEKKR